MTPLQEQFKKETGNEPLILDAQGMTWGYDKTFGKWLESKLSARVDIDWDKFDTDFREHWLDKDSRLRFSEDTITDWVQNWMQQFSPLTPVKLPSEEENKLLDDIRWRVNDIRDTLMNPVYGLDQWSAPIENLKLILVKIDSQSGAS